ncbi:hypothetical protein QBC43DRAFT_334637 [Cladorrhinum sp. PSN259]|nr:hypothetical protein QBC43DRAFT_334637 [Cladorrhinum sp. PSN259]
MSLLSILVLALGVTAFPAASSPEQLEAAAVPLEARQSTNPLTGTCTVATNQCTVTWPGSTSTYNFTCGAYQIIAGPSGIDQTKVCKVDGAPCTAWISIINVNTDCGCRVTNSC